MHDHSVHVGGWVGVLICVSAVSLLIVWIASIRQSRRLNLINEWRIGRSNSNVFQGANEWADINEAADRDDARRGEFDAEPNIKSSQVEGFDTDKKG